MLYDCTLMEKKKEKEKSNFHQNNKLKKLLSRQYT